MNNHLIPQATSPLAAWLYYLEHLHSQAIELGLDRVKRVAERLDLLKPAPYVFTVAGTNGKGTTCRTLEAILLAAGLRVGVYSSPHLVRYTERVRIQGQELDETEHCHSFAELEAGRGEISLTYFEYGTLSALYLFRQAALDVVILEVGLGGRLDATNVFESAAAVITSVDIDHVGFLGDTREAIGFEKAGIFRAHQPAVCADPNPPQSLIDHANAIGADLKLINRDFSYQVIQDDQRKQWRFIGEHSTRNSLAMPAMRGDYQLAHASAALAALDALREQLPVTQQAVRVGISNAVVRGRFQVLPGQPTTILDVAHNPHAARALAKNINQMGYAPYTHAVFGAMADKDIGQVLRIMRDVVDHWYVCDLPSARAATAEQLRAILLDSGFVADQDHSVQTFDSVQSALAHLSASVPTQVSPNDRIIIFGSFVTVEQALKGLPRFPSVPAEST